MKKISQIIIVIGCLFMLCACYSKEEKKVLNEYEMLTKEDYNTKYTFLHDENNVFESIKYESLMKKLKKGIFILYMGGAWCPNCQASIKFINQIAKNLNIDTVYNFDTRISGTKTKENDIRNCNNEAQTALYRELIETLGYVNPQGTTSGSTDIPRLSVPAVIAIKNGKAVAFCVREYLYDEEKDFLYITNDETNYRDAYLNELESLMSKIK